MEMEWRYRRNGFNEACKHDLANRVESGSFFKCCSCLQPEITTSLSWFRTSCWNARESMNEVLDHYFIAKKFENLPCLLNNQLKVLSIMLEIESRRLGQSMNHLGYKRKDRPATIKTRAFPWLICRSLTIPIDSRRIKIRQLYYINRTMLFYNVELNFILWFSSTVQSG